MTRVEDGERSFMTLLFLVQPSRQSPSLEAFPTMTEALSSQSHPVVASLWLVSSIRGVYQTLKCQPMPDE